MISAVLDANVLVSAFPSKRGAPAALIDRWLDREFRLITSEHILDGAARAWSKPWFRQRFTQHEAERALVVIRTLAVIVTLVAGVHGIAADEEDDLILATAAAGGADYLITGDRYLLALGHYQSIAIHSPRQFVTILNQLPG